jgi:hypothetical protein
MLSMPILNRRIGKWILALSEFELRFESAKAVKGQIIADFITEHRDSSINFLKITPWVFMWQRWWSRYFINFTQGRNV